jgi:hypothetical protein
MLSRRGLSILGGAIAIGLLVSAGVVLYRGFPVSPSVELMTPYQAIVLTTGQVYFGKLEKFGTAYPILTDAYYIQSQVNQDTKQVTNTLVKRGKELHGPSVMVLNAQHILFIETVNPDSTVGKLIEEAKNK